MVLLRVGMSIVVGIASMYWEQFKDLMSFQTLLNVNFAGLQFQQ